MISLKNLSFNYEKKKILEDLSLTLKKGETLALIGSSGSGKTTLLKLISGILKPHSGTIEVPSLAYMSQQDLLLPWRNVEDNVTLSLELENLPINKDHIQSLLESLEIASLKKNYPHELSGGQYKRVMLARTLAPQKKVLLLDEAFASLDLPLREKLYHYLKKLPKTTTLLVTHDFHDAFSLANRIVLLSKGQIKKEWNISDELKEDPSQMGLLFKDLKLSLNS